MEDIGLGRDIGLGGTGPEELENTELGKLAGQRGELGTADGTRHQTVDGAGGHWVEAAKVPPVWGHWDEGCTREASGTVEEGRGLTLGWRGRGITHDSWDTEPAWFRTNHIKAATAIRSPLQDLGHVRPYGPVAGPAPGAVKAGDTHRAHRRCRHRPRGTKRREKGAPGRDLTRAPPPDVPLAPPPTWPPPPPVSLNDATARELSPPPARPLARPAPVPPCHWPGRSALIAGWLGTDPPPGGGGSMAAAAATMAAEEAEEALGLFTGIGLSEAKARETLRNGALSALLRRAVLQVRPPRGRTLVPGPRSPVPRHPHVTSGPSHPGNSLPGTSVTSGTRCPDPP